jgi:hypothetical protein
MHVSKALRLARKYCQQLVSGGVGSNYVWEDTKVRVVFVRENAYSDEGQLTVRNKSTGELRVVR